jgi:MinD-like ATPase involved in chromosome partitioning or flagellar assembly
MSPTSSWEPQATQHASGETPVSVLLVGEVGQRLLTWQQAVTMDARFRMAALANDPSDFQAKLSYSPEVVILDAMIFKGPQMLLQALTSISGAAYVILPASVSTSDDPEVKELSGKLKTLPSVKQIFLGDAPISDLLQRAYGDALALRKTIAAPMSWANRTQGMASVSGLRVITVWNRVGGVGKTTLAAALAMAVARRGLRSLLVGLDAPDVMPLHLSLKSEPNILGWFATPTDTGIKNSLQHVGDLDVLSGFPDILAEKAGLEAGDKNSISSLVTTAAYGGYAAIILDAPASSGIASLAILAANTWVLVARPTLADAWASVDALRTVTQRAAGQHRISPGNIFVVLNMRGGGMLSPNEWHQVADSACRKLGLATGFPPVAAVIPFVSGVPLSQDAGRPTLDSDDEFARPIHGLADMLFGGTGPSNSRKKDGKKFSLGGFSVKVKA